MDWSFLICDLHADWKTKLTLTLIALIAALLYIVLSQFTHKKTILLANVTGSLMIQLYVSAVCSLPLIYLQLIHDKAGRYPEFKRHVMCWYEHSQSELCVCCICVQFMRTEVSHDMTRTGL